MSGGERVAARVAPAWSDREVSLMLPAAGASHQPWNGYRLCSFFKCCSLSQNFVFPSPFLRESSRLSTNCVGVRKK